MAACMQRCVVAAVAACWTAIWCALGALVAAPVVGLMSAGQVPLSLLLAAVASSALLGLLVFLLVRPTPQAALLGVPLAWVTPLSLAVAMRVSEIPSGAVSAVFAGTALPLTAAGLMLWGTLRSVFRRTGTRCGNVR